MVSPQVFRNLRQTSCTDAHLLAGIFRYRTQLRVRRRAETSLFHFVKLVYCPQKRASLQVMRVARHSPLAGHSPISGFLSPAEFWVIFVGSIFRPGSPLGVVGREIHQRATPVDLFGVECPKRRLVGTLPTCDGGPGWIAADLARMKPHEPLRRY